MRVKLHARPRYVCVTQLVCEDEFRHLFQSVGITAAQQPAAADVCLYFFIETDGHARVV